MSFLVMAVKYAKHVVRPRLFPKATIVRGKNRTLGYTPFARAFLRAHPNFIRDFKTAFSELERNYGNPVEVNGLKLEVNPGKFLKATCGRDKLFIKVGRGTDAASAVSQLETLEKAGGILRRHGIEPMRYHFAFSSNLGGKKTDFLVAKYFNLKSVAWVPSPLYETELEPRFRAADKELMENGIHDLESRNILYDPKRKRMIAFDLFPGAKRHIKSKKPAA
ncbi:MAG: hypothetical protein Q8N60_01810 [Candidatus Diapherotrites archaeon]|nr:hypothetical protein [Candidatus Diapherotrites archaeon]